MSSGRPDLAARLPLIDHGAIDELHGFVEGAPDWLRATVNFCSRCGVKLTYGPVDGEHRDRATCAACRFIAYVNPRLVVTTIPGMADGQIVLLRRAIEPGYGAWAQPGGFLEADETAIGGAIRETQEETGLVVEPLSIVGLYSRPQAAIVVVAFEARITGGAMTATRRRSRCARSRQRRSPGRRSPSTPASGPWPTGSAAPAPTSLQACRSAAGTPAEPVRAS